IEVPPLAQVSYRAFVDPSGGSSDSMTLAIAHQEKSEKAVLDLVREVKPPFSPDAVVQQFAQTLKQYRIREVTGDRYAAAWPQERFQAHSITYKPSEMVKGVIYLTFLPLLNSQRVELLDNSRLVSH